MEGRHRVLSYLGALVLGAACGSGATGTGTPGDGAALDAAHNGDGADASPAGDGPRPDGADGPSASTVTVRCGSGDLVVTCGPGQVCCMGPPSPPGCADSCPAPARTAACDGPEDCPGARCCFTDAICDICYATSCAPSCAGLQVCNAGADCPPERPACCQLLNQPIRFCMPSADPTRNCN